MPDWKSIERKKIKSMDEAIRSLPKNAAIIMGMASMESQGFMSRVHEFADHFEHLRVLSCLNMQSYEFCEDPRYEGTFMNENWFFGPSNRKAAKMGYKLVDFIPNNLHQAGGNKLRALKEEGATIVYWGPVTPMQERTGFFNLGLSNVYEGEVIEAADMVVLEVNNRIPFLHGDTQVHISQADMLVEYDAEPADNPQPRARERWRKRSPRTYRQAGGGRSNPADRHRRHSQRRGCPSFG
jgi:acyl-CoA hydrolase